MVAACLSLFLCGICLMCLPGVSCHSEFSPLSSKESPPTGRSGGYASSPGNRYLLPMAEAPCRALRAEP